MREWMKWVTRMNERWVSEASEGWVMESESISLPFALTSTSPTHLSLYPFPAIASCVRAWQEKGMREWTKGREARWSEWTGKRGSEETALPLFPIPRLMDGSSRSHLSLLERVISLSYLLSLLLVGFLRSLSPNQYTRRRKGIGKRYRCGRERLGEERRSEWAN